MSRLFITLLFAVGLASCSNDPAADPQAERDSAVAGALSEPIMTDPDLAGQSRNDTAVSGGGPATAEVPPHKRTPEEVERARQAARDLLGGAIDPAPFAEVTTDQSKLARAVTMEAIVAALKLGPAQCPAKVGYSFNWSARLPASLPIYPRGHAMVAAGTDDAGCKLRAVRFVTPVPVNDVIDFYFAMASKADLTPERRSEGTDQIVAGRNDAGAYAIYVRQRADGLSEVDLVTSGL